MSNYFYGRDNSVNFSQIVLVVLVAILPLFGGCGEDDNPIIDDGHDHDHSGDAPMHADADGFILEVDEKEVYLRFKGRHGGGLTVNVGQEIEVHTVFLDADGHEVHLHEVESVDDQGQEEEFALEMTGYDNTIIAIHLDHIEEEQGNHGEEDHGETGEEDHGDELTFGVEGLKAGTTKIKLQLLHGDHPDYTTGDDILIPVTVQ